MNKVQRDGLLLAASAVVGMAVMNSPWAAGFDRLMQTPVMALLGQGADLASGLLLMLHKLLASVTLKLAINDFLMVIFFLSIGIEIKHEWLHGALATKQARVLPLGAALGGMAVPALIYVALNWHTPAHLTGWAIPAATDIAFALGLMALLAPRTRPALLAFLTAVAVLDDLGAIVVIAVFYTEQLSGVMLGLAAVAIALMALLAKLRVLSAGPYIAVGAVLWLCIVKSGVHATLAGVIMGLLIPSPQQGRSPSKQIDHAIKPWISWVILPLFGAVNAGVALAGFGWAALVQPVILGIALGLALGKPIGILLGTWAASKLGGGLPPGLKLPDYLPVACFCGIGFTMALFIANLAFDASSAAASAAKLGVLLGTLLALLLGSAVARRY